MFICAQDRGTLANATTPARMAISNILRPNWQKDPSKAVIASPGR
jgi:hypothetical protein